MLPRMSEQVYCREQALDEPLAGTAKGPLRRWVLIEDGLPWKAKLPRDSQLPAAVRERLAQIDADPHTRVQLIRRPGRGQGTRRKVFVVECAEAVGDRRLAELELELDAIAQLDPDALAARAASCSEQAALWLVCTHGTRDRCCAKWGVPLWSALAKLEGERVWQSSHLGGHRFAPTFLALPSGLLYGQFGLDEVEALRAELQDGRVGALERLRGRSCYPPAAQRAEIELRRNGGWGTEGQLRLIACEAREVGGALVRFDTPAGERRVEVEPAATLATPSSCGDAPSPRQLFTLRTLEAG